MIRPLTDQEAPPGRGTATGRFQRVCRKSKAMKTKRRGKYFTLKRYYCYGTIRKLRERMERREHRRKQNTVKIIETILHVPYGGNRWSSVPDPLCSRTGKQCAAHGSASKGLEDQRKMHVRKSRFPEGRLRGARRRCRKAFHTSCIKCELQSNTDSDACKSQFPSM